MTSPHSVLPGAHVARSARHREHGWETEADEPSIGCRGRQCRGQDELFQGAWGIFVTALIVVVEIR